MSSDRNQVIATYSELAGQYDDAGNVRSCWTVHSDHIIASLNLKPRFQTVAEVGCGTGRALYHLASRCDPTVRFIGVEPAEEMRQRALALNRTKPSVSILDGTFETLPLESGSVDYLFSVDAFHWSQPQLAVSEMAALGISGLPLLVVQHPLGGERPEAVARRALQAVEQLASLIGRVA